MLPVCSEYKQDQDHRPETEHDFHFTQQMPDTGVLRLTMCQMFKECGGEGVNDSQSE